MFELTRWFIVESKSFMGYGKDTSKLRFWVEFPLAYVKFMWFQMGR